MGARKANTVRIIAGQWRSRRVAFPDAPGLRPTPDRVRETLFNWLRNVIDGSRCLDLFAGSGALGFEALSRGAAQTVLVDSQREVVNALRANAALLGAQGATIVHADGASFLDGPGEPFDIVFVDPPFQAGLWGTICARLESGGWLRPQSFVYLEMPRQSVLPPLPAHWQLHREAHAGEVSSRLLRRAPSP